jgi:hypothetical protein
MPLILLSAKGVAQMLRDGKSFEETNIPSLFKVTKDRLTSTRNEILGVDTGKVVRSKL